MSTSPFRAFILGCVMRTHILLAMDTFDPSKLVLGAVGGNEVNKIFDGYVKVIGSCSHVVEADISGMDASHSETTFAAFVLFTRHIERMAAQDNESRVNLDLCINTVERESSTWRAKATLDNNLRGLYHWALASGSAWTLYLNDIVNAFYVSCVYERATHVSKIKYLAVLGDDNIMCVAGQPAPDNALVRQMNLGLKSVVKRAEDGTVMCNHFLLPGAAHAVINPVRLAAKVLGRHFGFATMHTQHGYGPLRSCQAQIRSVRGLAGAEIASIQQSVGDLLRNFDRVAYGDSLARAIAQHYPVPGITLDTARSLTSASLDFLEAFRDASVHQVAACFRLQGVTPYRVDVPTMRFYARAPKQADLSTMANLYLGGDSRTLSEGEFLGAEQP